MIPPRVRLIQNRAGRLTPRGVSGVGMTVGVKKLNRVGFVVRMIASGGRGVLVGVAVGVGVMVGVL